MHNPIGIHLSHWQHTWRDDLRPLISRAKSAGYTVAEFPLLFPQELKLNELRAELDDLGMGASCSTGLNPKQDITSPDAELRKAGLKHLQTCLEAAARLGSPLLGGVTYAPWGFFPNDDHSARWTRCIESLKIAGEMAGDLGLTLCLEVLNRFEGYLLNTVEQGLQLLEEVGSPHIKLQLDTFHLNIEADEIGAEIREAGAALGHFHCVANNRKAPGRGHIPWKRVWEALRAIDYRGFLVVETFVSPAGEVGQGLFIWRELAADLDENAFQAAAFIQQELQRV